MNAGAPAAGPGTGAGDPTGGPEPEIPASLEALFPADLRRDLLALRRDLHRHPELSWEEERTCRRLREALEPLEPAALEGVARTGLTARIRGRDPDAPAVAIRGDIDALPIQERTGLPWASEVPGVMHACGHDVHATWAVGAASLLARAPAAGDVVVVLQPAEEKAEGARAVLDSGALEGVRAIFGGHVDRRFRVGQVVAQAGPLAASADFFDVELLGAAAHGARPHEGADPLAGASALVEALYAIVPRRLGPARPAVLSVGVLRAGTAPNVVPERAELAGTFRATDPEARELLAAEVRRIAEATASAFRLEARVEVRRGVPPILVPEEPADWARRAVRRVLGEEALVPLGPPNMAGEDFALYMESIPGCFLRVGAREAGADPIPAHSPRFYAADGSLFVGAAVLAETARIASAALADRAG